MSNMSSFIKHHNRNILSSPPDSEENCLVAGSCLKTWIVYRDNVTYVTYVYYGASDGEFKYRYNNH